MIVDLGSYVQVGGRPAVRFERLLPAPIERVWAAVTDPEQLPAGWRQSAEWAHFGGISLAREPLAGRLVALASELRAQGMRLSYDPNYRNLMQTGYRPVFEAMCRLADVIKLSDEEIGRASCRERVSSPV